jgi:hypothetical protein
MLVLDVSEQGSCHEFLAITYMLGHNDGQVIKKV